jgi:hypothetical protein
LFAASQRLFHLPAHGDVAADTQHRAHVAIAANGNDARVPPVPPTLHEKMLRLLAGQRGSERVQPTFPLTGGWQKVIGVVANDLVRADTTHRATDVEQLSLFIQHADDVRRVGQNLGQPL